MITRTGPHPWQNVHATERARVEDLVYVDNTAPGGAQPTGFQILRNVARELDALAAEAAGKGKRIRALGAGWALTDIAVTDGWLINTRRAAGCFDLAPRFFEAAFPDARRPYVVLAQCGITVGELNVHLEVAATSGVRRALKTSGIGAGQTIAGAISGNTHGAAVNFGATPDFVVGLQVVTGAGESLWIERASQPVLNDAFLQEMSARRIRDDDVFNAAIVSFGAFGIITAVALETDPVYHLQFAPVADIRHDDLKQKLRNFDSGSPPGLYHYEFIFNPFSSDGVAMEAAATRVPYEEGHQGAPPVWIVRNDRGFALGDRTGIGLFNFPLVSASQKTAVQFKQYRQRCILSDVRGTPGQLFTATISYFEGFTESAFGVSITDAARTMEISTEVIRRLKLPSIAQVRVVHPSRALLGFTYLGPKTVVFEFGLVNDARYALFENHLTAALAAEGIRYTFHWSKNSGITPARLREMYGDDRVARWMDARRRVFGGDTALMAVFHNGHLARAGLG